VLVESLWNKIIIMRAPPWRVAYILRVGSSHKGRGLCIAAE
jgi:hypothetical protein